MKLIYHLLQYFPSEFEFASTLDFLRPFSYVAAVILPEEPKLVKNLLNFNMQTQNFKIANIIKYIYDYKTHSMVYKTHIAVQ
jgi:hypothetical protein